MEIEDKLNLIFEAVEDEEEAYRDMVHGDMYRDLDSAERIRQDGGHDDIDDDGDDDDKARGLVRDLEDDEDYSAAGDWTGIPNPPKGKTLDDLKNARVMGPPLKIVDGNMALADQSIIYDDANDRYHFPQTTRKISAQEYNALLDIAKSGDDERALQAQQYVNKLHPIDEHGHKIEIVDGVPASAPYEYQIEGSRFKGGKITYDVWKTFTPKMRQEFKPVDRDGEVINVADYDEKDFRKILSHFERQRDNIDREFLAGEDDSRWYFDDVVRALKPYAMGIANKIHTPTYERHEAFTDAISAIRQAWLTDLGASPFHNHAYKTMLASAKDAANRARNIPPELVGQKRTDERGVRQWTSTSKGVASADAPLGGTEDGDATIGMTLAKDIGDSEEAAEEVDIRLKSLISGLVNLEEVGLTEREKAILLLTHGISHVDPSKSAVWTDQSGNKVTGPVPGSHIAKKMGVSPAAISQKRSSAMRKLRQFMELNEISSLEHALEVFGLEEAKKLAGALIESIISIIELECEVLSETKNIKINTNVDGISRNLTFIVDSDTFEVCSILDESSEIFERKVDGSVIREAIIDAKILSGSRYFSEMASQVISMHCAPILGVINNNVNESHKSPYNIIGEIEYEDLVHDVSIRDYADQDEMISHIESLVWNKESESGEPLSVLWDIIMNDDILMNKFRSLPEPV